MSTANVSVLDRRRPRLLEMGNSPTANRGKMVGLYV